MHRPICTATESLMMKSYRLLSILSILTIGAFLLMGCSSDPEEMNVTVEVVVTQEVEATRVEVTRVVEVSEKIAVTPIAPTPVPTPMPIPTPTPTPTATPTPAPTPSPTPISHVIPEGWSQYTSLSGQYSVAYPSNWIIRDEGLATLELQISASEFISIGFLPQVHRAVLGEYDDRVEYLKVLATGLVEGLSLETESTLTNLTFQSDGEVSAPNTPVYVTASFLNSGYVRRTQSILMTYATDGHVLSPIVYINYRSRSVPDATIEAIQGVVRSMVFQ
jgi:hypothetical protein